MSRGLFPNFKCEEKRTSTNSVQSAPTVKAVAGEDFETLRVCTTSSMLGSKGLSRFPPSKAG